MHLLYIPQAKFKYFVRGNNWIYYNLTVLVVSKYSKLYYNTNFIETKQHETIQNEEKNSA